ncbi:BrnT family toxin [candidate division KSB1 bacterium]|nr:BrnT family toxin [candidate division KSB1 bacterium]
MLKFDWNPDKNESLKKERDISFEQIIFHLQQGDVWKIADHPDQEKYPGQQIYFVIVDRYVYLVPFIKTDDGLFLKTIIPSRKATKEYNSEFGD